jgi:signal transduction histidine kinase
MNSIDIIKNIFKLKGSIVTLVMTFVLIIILFLISIKYIIPSFEEQMMLNTVDESRRVSQHLISVYEDDNTYKHMKRMKNDLQMEKVKFFDKNGFILYSTSQKDIGKVNTKEYFHNIVAKGKVFYKIVKKGKKTLEGRLIQTDVAEVYIPIMKDGKFQYAFEVYYDISEKVKSFERLLFKIKSVNYLVVFLIIIAVFIRLYSASKFDIQNKKVQKKLAKSEKMAALGEMIGNIAHQWRQPLSVISMASTSMQLHKQTNLLDDEMFNKSCESINRNAQYLSDTIDDFRNYIKGDRVLIEFNLEKMIKDFLLLINSSSKSSNIKIITNLQKDIVLHAYPNELIQCFVNLFSNAKDVLLKQDENSRYMFISTSIEDKNVVIKIKDNGGGIPEKIINKVFEPYFTTKHQSQGTGLGLHMTYDLIVNGANGSLEVNNVEYQYKSKKYKGAEFTITIPNVTRLD